MTLILQTVRTPSGVPAETRQVTGGTFRIGRGSDSDWTLPDPDRVLSKDHCRLVENGGGWLLHDTSSNGTLLNGRGVVSDMPETLRDGDHLTLGPYEIEARLAGFPGEFDRSDEGAGRVTADPFPSPGLDEFGLALQHDDPRARFEPISIDEAFAPDSEIAADRASDLREHVRLPRPLSDLLPEDWNVAPDPDVRAVGPADERAVPPPEKETALRPSEPPPPLPAPPVASAFVAPAPLPVASSDHPAWPGFQAFLDGAGMNGGASAEPDAALRDLGAAFRAMVGELRKTMIARATIKGEFRIEQTVLRSEGNNPLKFATDDVDALSALLGVGRRTAMSPRRAVADAIRDIRLHELAAIAAMQRAVVDLLATLSPSAIAAAECDTPLDTVLGRRDGRLWRAFRQRHEAVTRALSDDFDSVFGKSFARAYETALREAELSDPIEEGDVA